MKFSLLAGRKKGMETAATVLGAVFIAAAAAFFFYYIFPLFFGDLFKSIALASAEIVARDIAGFISVSGVAPNEIKITYNPSETNKYNVEIKERIVKVFRETENLPKEVEPVKEIAIAKSAVGNINENFNFVNFFEIRKNVVTSIGQSGTRIFSNNYEVAVK